MWNFDRFHQSHSSSTKDKRWYNRSYNRQDDLDVPLPEQDKHNSWFGARRISSKSDDCSLWLLYLGKQEIFLFSEQTMWSYVIHFSVMLNKGTRDMIEISDKLPPSFFFVEIGCWWDNGNNRRVSMSVINRTRIPET